MSDDRNWIAGNGIQPSRPAFMDEKQPASAKATAVMIGVCLVGCLPWIFLIGRVILKKLECVE